MKFKKTASGGCFKQGAGGRFVKKYQPPRRSRLPPPQYQPSYGQQGVGKSFRPKSTLADCKRSITQLQHSLHQVRKRNAQHQAQQSALQTEIDSIKSTPTRQRVEQLSSSVHIAKERASRSRLKAEQLRRQRDVARSQLLLSHSAMAAQAAQHKDEVSKIEFEHSIEMEQMGETNAKLTQAMNATIKGKEHAIAKAQAQAKQYRQHWTKAHVQKSRLQVKLKSTVERFETQASGAKSRNRKDVTGLLAELQVLVTSSESDRSRSEIQQSKLNSAISKMQQELDAATGPIDTMKNGRDFSDEIVLLTWELMAMGVSSNIVGDVEAFITTPQESI